MCITNGDKFNKITHTNFINIRNRSPIATRTSGQTHHSWLSCPTTNQTCGVPGKDARSGLPRQRLKKEKLLSQLKDTNKLRRLLIMDYQCTSQIEYFQNSTDLTMEMDPMIYQPTSLEPGNWGIQHSNIKVLQHTVDAILRGNYMSLLVQ